MKHVLFLTTLAAGLLFALPSTALANQATPPSGTVFMLKPGDKQKITVKGFSGCKFEVLTMSDNMKVATVSESSGAKKSHKVEIEAQGPGMAQVSVTTQNGTNPGCEGFVFNYTVMVEPDVKALEKAAKTKFKDAEKSIKDAIDQVVKEYCDGVDETVAAVKAGELTIDEALDAIEQAGASLAGILPAAVGFTTDFVYSQVWSCPEAQGFTSMDEDLVGLLPGGCGEFDKFMGKIESLVEKAQKKIDQKIKKAYKQLEKFAKDIEGVILAITQAFLFAPPPITPVPLPAEPAQMPAPPAPKPLEHTWTSSGRISTDSTTRLRIGGMADGTAGQVTVEITGPDGFSDSVMVDVGSGCEFVATFDDIKPGEYTVKITQGDQSSTFKATAA